MQHVPTPFGFPAWQGVKHRLAKKILASYGRNIYKRWYKLSQLRIGDLVSTCDGLNSRVLEVYPVYVYTRHGKILRDIDISTDKTNCSVYHCGVGLPISYAEAVAYKEELVSYYQDNDYMGFAERYGKMTIHEDGTYTR